MEKFLDQEKILNCIKFFAFGEIIDLSFLKMKLYDKKILMLTPVRYIFVNFEEKLNLPSC